LEVIRKKPTVIIICGKPQLALKLKQFFPNKKIVWYVHSSESQRAFTNYLPKINDHLDGVLFVSTFSKNLFEIEMVKKGIKTTTCYVVENGIDIDQFALKEKLENNENDEFTILFAGSLIQRKGLDRIINIFPSFLHKCPNAKLLIAGGPISNSNNYFMEIMEMITALNINEKVSFLGHIPHNKMSTVYQNADVLIFPSVDLEGLPLTILEAQSCGLPVIASNTGAVKDVINNGENGFIVNPPGSPEKILESLMKLYENPELRKKMSEVGRRRIVDQYSLSEMAKRFLQTIYEIEKKPIKNALDKVL